MTWGRILSVRCPELHPSPPIPLTHQGVGSSGGLGVHRCYTVPLLPSVSECLNPKLEALLTNRLVREERSLFSQSLLHTIHISELCPDQAYWAAQRGKESPAPNPEFSKLPDLLKFSPTHSNYPHPFSSPAWLLCMWSSTVAWCVMG